MSGLVEIVDVYWHHQDRALIFIVKSKSKDLFQQGSLTATHLKAAHHSGQPLCVDLAGLYEARQVEE